MKISQSKNRQEGQNEIDKWNTFSDSTLISEIKRLSDSGNHWEFVKSTYPLIKDSKLKERINALLLEAAMRLPVEKKTYEFSAKAIYICAKLHLPQSAEVILKVIKDIEEPSNIHDPSVLPYLNDAIKELRLSEATEFLSKQLDALAGIKRSDHERYWKYASALFALEVIDVERSKLYRHKLELHPAYKPVSEWSQLRDDELKIEIRKNIQGVGGWEGERYLSFIPECYEKLDDDEFRQRVDKILVELMSEVAYGVGERAIYVCSNLPLANIRERILEIIRKTDRMFEIINKSPVVEDWSTYIGYIRELDNAVRQLNLVEAKDFLTKQLSPLEKPSPKPVTKEYYLYYLAKSALDALKRIDPKLAKQYSD